MEKREDRVSSAHAKAIVSHWNIITSYSWKQATWERMKWNVFPPFWLNRVILHKYFFKAEGNPQTSSQNWTSLKKKKNLHPLIMKRIERKERWAAVMGEQALAWKQRDWEVIQSRKQYLYYRNSHGINMKEVVDSLIKEKRSNTSNLVISLQWTMRWQQQQELVSCYA